MAPALAIPFFAIAAALVLAGLAASHSSSHGTQSNPGWAVWQYLGISLRATFSLLAKADRWLVSKFASAQLGLLSAWFSAFAVVWRVFFQTVGEVAHATSQAVAALDEAVPRIARREAAPAKRQARVAQRTAERADARARHATTTLDHYRTRTDVRLHALSHAVDVTLPNDLARIRARNKALERGQAKDRGAIGELEQGAAKTWDWIRSHPLSAATGAFAGAVLIALSRFGFGFLRCRSWQNLGRSITCGMAQWVGDLLALLVPLAGFISLLEFRNEEEKVIAEVRQLVLQLWNLENEL